MFFDLFQGITPLKIKPPNLLSQCISVNACDMVVLIAP